MSSKKRYSSFEDYQLLVENWRQYNSVDERIRDRIRKAGSIAKDIALNPALDPFRKLSGPEGAREEIPDWLKNKDNPEGNENPIPSEPTPVDVEEVPDDVEERPGPWGGDELRPQRPQGADEPDSAWSTSTSAWGGPGTVDLVVSTDDTEQVPDVEPAASKKYTLNSNFNGIKTLKSSWNSTNRNKTNLSFESDLSAFLNFIGPFVPTYLFKERNKDTADAVGKISSSNILIANKDEIVKTWKSIKQRDPTTAGQINRMAKIFQKKQSKGILNSLLQNLVVE